MDTISTLQGRTCFYQSSHLILFLSTLISAILLLMTHSIAIAQTFTESSHYQDFLQDDSSGSPVYLEDIQADPALPDMFLQDTHPYADAANQLHGPITISNLYDNKLGYIINGRFNTGKIGNIASALELEGGARNLRANVTIGAALTNHDMLKITGERLEQQLDFQFLSGTSRQWVGQNAVGITGLHSFDHAAFQAIEFGGYRSHASNKTLSDKTIFEPQTNVPFLETRRIAGADSSNGNATAIFKLWPHSQMKAGVDYDRVDYDVKYAHHAPNVNGFGGHVEWQQLVTKQIRFSVNAQARQPYDQYGGEIGWLVPTSKDKQVELGLTSQYVRSKTTHQHYLTSGLTISLLWGLDHNHAKSPSYHDFQPLETPSLSSWVDKPAVRMAEVLAIADSGGLRLADGIGFCPAIHDIVHNGTDYRSSDGQWILGTPPPLSAVPDVTRFVHATINANGLVECTYVAGTVNMNELSLVNSQFNHATIVNNRFWSQTLGSIFLCHGSADGSIPGNNPRNCPFRQQTALATTPNPNPPVTSIDELRPYFPGFDFTTLSQPTASLTMGKLSG